MLKLNTKRLAPLPFLLVVGNAPAHPGSHAEFSGWESVSHFLSSPTHAGLATGVALVLAATLIWSAKRGR